jgi:hypothetical protein
VVAVAAVTGASSIHGDDHETQADAQRRRAGRAQTSPGAVDRRAATPGSRTGTGTIQGAVRRARRLPIDARQPERPRGYPERDRTAGSSTPNARIRSSPSSSPTGNSDPLPPPAALQEALSAAPSTGSSWVLFRNTVVGTSGSSAVEPTAANDRNGILVTGNFYANTSDDNGLTVSSDALDPSDEEVYGGFCCDQVAYAVDRGDYSLVFWLIQYRYDAGAQKNALKLRMFKGRSSLLSQSDTCDWNFEPARNFELEARQWFDFNQVSHTADFLYITTNVRDAEEATDPADASNDPRVGGLIFRIPLDALDDGDCSIGYRYWYEEGHPYISPVQNAGSTMYLATHVPGFLEGDNLRIYSIADGSTSLEKRDKDISNFKDIDGNCPLPDGNDPCEDQHSGRMSGFRSGDTIGWLWMGDEDGEFPYPHVRVAVFETGSLDKILEHQIWSRDFAWQLPSVGVNQSGDLGVVLYAMGGGRFPKAQGFILDSPRNWNIQMHAIAESTSGADGWGHYGSVRRYGNCPDTFLASVYTSEGGVQKGRLVWFGKEGDGCADLNVSTLMVLPATLERGAKLSMTQITRNIGSATAGASTTRYYLSRDTSKSSDDLLLPAETPVPSLVRGGSVTGPVANAIIPSSASGVYRILACADDRAVVTEITDTNNCHVGVQSVTVK